MPSKIPEIIADFPQFRFKKSRKSFWSSPNDTIYYNSSAVELLHEISHALLGHTNYTTDVDLVQKERAAWTKAKQLAKKYDIHIPDKKVEYDLDSYRDWLHVQSTCPTCSQNGVQNPDTLQYHCFACNTVWKVNHNPYKRVKRTKITP